MSQSDPSPPKQPELFAVAKGIDLRPHKTIRIAVSGDVHLTRLETQIIDTADFQRLRYIRQLGPTYFVFPTAVHTRFDHSLGVLHMAHTMITAIRANRHNTDDERNVSEEQEVLTRLFALLHDIGHIPFGHTLEDEFHVFPRHDRDPERLQRFLGEESPIGHLIRSGLGQDLYDRFLAIYNANEGTVTRLREDAFVYDLIANTACADLLDYLRRDFFFCNLALDTDYRFLNFLYVANDSGVRRLVIRLWKPRVEIRQQARRDLLSELVRLLDNRYLLGERVYFHHAKLIAGAMIAAAVSRAKRNKEISLGDLYSMGDETLLRRLADSPSREVRRLGEAIQRRTLWKEIWDRGRDTVEATQERDRGIDVWKFLSEQCRDADIRMETEDRVAGLLGIDSGDLLFYCPDEDMNLKAARMKVFWNGRVQTLEDVAKQSADRSQDSIAAKLNATAAAHLNLWSLRAFLNPQQARVRQNAEQGCEYQFAFNAADRNRRGQEFFTSIAHEVVAEKGIATAVAHERYREKVGGAVDRILSHHAASLDRTVIAAILTDAFDKDS